MVLCSNAFPNLLEGLLDYHILRSYWYPEGQSMKVRDVVRRLEVDGWRLVRQKGHRAFRHPEKPMVVTVPGNWNDDLPVGAFKSILRKAELNES
jgi:predicted RNA binding protein YcfA (HicA-like mRNA interferase family)